MMTPTGLRNADGWMQGLGIYGPKDCASLQRVAPISASGF